MASSGLVWVIWGSSLVAWRLGVSAFTAVAHVPLPTRGTWIPGSHAVQPKTKKKFFLTSVRIQEIFHFPFSYCWQKSSTKRMINRNWPSASPCKGSDGWRRLGRLGPVCVSWRSSWSLPPAGYCCDEPQARTCCHILFSERSQNLLYFFF